MTQQSPQEVALIWSGLMDKFQGDDADLFRVPTAHLRTLCDAVLASNEAELIQAILATFGRLGPKNALFNLRNRLLVLTGSDASDLPADKLPDPTDLTGVAATCGNTGSVPVGSQGLSSGSITHAAEPRKE